MPSRSPSALSARKRGLAGSHRGRHRALPAESDGVPKASPFRVSGAAAAAIALTAIGAIAVPAMTSGPAAAQSAARSSTTRSAAPTSPHRRGHVATDAQHIAGARTAIRHRELVEQVAERRAEARARASRAAARQRVLDRQRAALAAARAWQLPVEDYRFSSPFGMRWGRLHAGDDFAAPIGTPVAALSKGTVSFVGQQSGYGNKVEIRFWDGTVGWYAHLSRIDVEVGDRVKVGETIGAVGNSGHSTGPHLHLEIHPGGGDPVDPRRWFASHHLTL